MTRFGAVLSLIVLIWGPAAHAQSFQSGGPEQQAAIAVIQQQLNALKAADGSKAFSYAAPNIKQRFQSPDIFMTMVRQGYGILIDPRDVEFLDLRTVSGDLLQAVRVIGQDGTSKIAIYQMQQQEDGSWKIAGVYMTDDNKADV